MGYLIEMVEEKWTKQSFRELWLSSNHTNEYVGGEKRESSNK